MVVHSNKVIHGDLTGVGTTFLGNSAGLIRCQLQPNVLIHSDGTACLADFGLSLMYSEIVTVSAASWTSAFHGNYRWLAPELLGDPEDELPVRPSKYSDIYSFGGIMLQVCLGTFFFLACLMTIDLAFRFLPAKCLITT